MTYLHPVWLAALALPAVAHAQTIQPGQWEITVNTTSADMPGAPPGVARSMRGAPRKISNCVTAEQASRGPKDMLKAAPNCTFTSYSMAGGKMTADMRCTNAGGTMTARTTGSFTPTSFSTTSNMTMTGRMTMKMTSATTGRRIGACTAKPVG